MKVIVGYIRILRPINIIISVITVMICADILNELQNTPLLIFTIMTVVLFIGGANTFNDIHDINTDKINKPYRPIVCGDISMRAAKIYFIILILTGVGFCLFLPVQAVLIALLIAIPVMILYSIKFKSKPLLGNLLISFLLGLTFLFCGFVFGNVFPMIIPASLAFFLTLVRELTKDIEDYVGDNKSGLRTMPIVFGLNKSIKLVIFFALVTGILSLIPYFINYYSWYYLIPLTLGVELPLTLVVVSFMFSPTILTAKKSSVLLKIATIMGIISIHVGATYGC